MPSLHQMFRQQFITDLVLPAPRPGESLSDLKKRGYDTALSLLQNFDAMIRFNPLVVGVTEEDPQTMTEAQLEGIRNAMQSLGIDINIAASGSEWKYFEIVDRLVYAFGLGQDIKYHSALRDREKGMESFTQAALGTLTAGRFILSVESEETGLRGDGVGLSSSTTTTNSTSSGDGKGERQDATAADERRLTVERSFARPDQQTPCVVITEIVVSSVLFGLHLFVANSIRDSHLKLHERLKEEWEKKMAE